MEDILRSFCVLSRTINVSKEIRGKYFPLFDIVGLTKINNVVCPLVFNLDAAFCLEPNSLYKGYLPGLFTEFNIRTSHKCVYFDFPGITLDPRLKYTSIVITDLDNSNITAFMIYIFENADVMKYNQQKYINYTGIRNIGIMKELTSIIEIPYNTNMLCNFGLINGKYKVYIPKLFDNYLTLTVNDDDMFITPRRIPIPKEGYTGIFITDIFDNIIIGTKCRLIVV